MKNKIIVILLFSNLLFSQQQYTAKYTVVATKGTIEDISFLEDDTKELRTTILSLFKDADKTLKILEYQLLVNNNNSLFSLITKSTPEFKLNQIAISSAEKDILYCNQSTTFRQTNFSGENIIITSSFAKNWTLLNEYKIIDGYKCFKATCEVPWRALLSLNDNKPNYTITAWYCPKIASKFGPKGYGGLPGLILELQDNKVTFLIKSINYDATEPIDFSKIDKIPHLTVEEYDKKVADRVSMFGLK